MEMLIIWGLGLLLVITLLVIIRIEAKIAAGEVKNELLESDLIILDQIEKLGEATLHACKELVDYIDRKDDIQDDHLHHHIEEIQDAINKFGHVVADKHNALVDKVNKKPKAKRKKRGSYKLKKKKNPVGRPPKK